MIGNLAGKMAGKWAGRPELAWREARIDGRMGERMDSDGDDLPLDL